MLNLWHDLPCGQHPPEIVTAVIEIPSGSRNKYELDKTSGMLKLDRVLFSAAICRISVALRSRWSLASANSASCSWS